MSVGLLLVTHGEIGATLLATARTLFGPPPLPCATLSVQLDSQPGQVQRDGARLLAELDQGDGVLILSDLYGATPCNIGQRLDGGQVQIAVVSGLNLPMLVRVLNYPALTLPELAHKAVSGGQEGVLQCECLTRPAFGETGNMQTGNGMSGHG